MASPEAAAAAAAAELPALLKKCRDAGLEVDVEGLLKYMMEQPTHQPPSGAALMGFARGRTPESPTAQPVPPHRETEGAMAAAEPDAESPCGASSQPTSSSRAPFAHEEAVSTVRSKPTSSMDFKKAAREIEPYPK